MKTKSRFVFNLKDRHVILKRQIYLLQGGVETPLDTRRSSEHAQCLINEHGPNCTYCVPSDSCEEGHFICDMNNGNKICLPGYRGDNCQFSTDLVNEYHVTCPENTCRNGGTCTSGRCCCRNGFTGILCEIEIIECKNQSCLNEGTLFVYNVTYLFQNATRYIIRTIASFL